MDTLQPLFERRFKEMLTMDLLRQQLTEALTLRLPPGSPNRCFPPERQFACDAEVYSPWPNHRPFPKFETIMKRWLDKPSPFPEIFKQVWIAAANSYSSVTGLPFVPYFMSMLLRGALDPLTKPVNQVKKRIQLFSLIVDCFKYHPNYQIKIRKPIPLKRLRELVKHVDCPDIYKIF